MRQHDEEGVGVDRIMDAVARHRMHLDLRRELREALQDVEIRREVAGLRDDLPAGAATEARGSGELEEIHRGGIADERLTRRGADQPTDALAERRRQVDPAVDVPAADEVDAPLHADRPRHAALGADGQRTERIAVEIDEVRRQTERLASRRQRIETVELEALLPGERRHPPSSRRMARIGVASTPAIGNGKATSS